MSILAGCIQILVYYFRRMSVCLFEPEACVCTYTSHSSPLLPAPLPSSPLLSTPLRSSPSTLSQIVMRVIRRLISKDKVLVRVDDNAQEDDDQVLMVHLNYAAQAD